MPQLYWVLSKCLRQERAKLSAVFSGALLLAIGMGLGRLLGLFRDYLIVSLLGVGESSDFFIILATLPDVLLSLVGGAVFSSVVVPWYRSGSDEDVVSNWSNGIGWMVIISILIAVILVVSHELILSLLLPSLSEKFLNQYSVYLVFIVLLFPITIVTQLRGCFLQSRLQFRKVSLSTPIFNVTFIIVALTSVLGVLAVEQALVVAVVMAVIVRGAYVISGTRLRSVISYGSPIQKREPFDFRYYILASIVGAGLVVIPVIIRSIESLEGDGAATYFHLGWRIYEFGIGLICYSVANSLIPRLGNSEAGGRDVYVSLASVIILLSTFAISAYVGSVWFGSTLAILISGSGVTEVGLSSVMRGYSPSMLFYGLVIFLSTVLIARRKASELLWSTALGFVSLLALYAVNAHPSIIFGAVSFCMLSVQLHRFLKDFAVSVSDLTCLSLSLCLVGMFWFFVHKLYLVGANELSSLFWSVISGLTTLAIGIMSSGTLRKLLRSYALGVLR